MGRHKYLAERINNVVDKAIVFRDAYVALTTAKFAGSEGFRAIENAEEDLVRAVDYLGELESPKGN